MAARIKIRDRDTGFKQFFNNIRNNGQGAVDVGVFADSPQIDKAIIHEFGAPRANIPQRSFIRGTFDEKKRDFTKFLKESVAQNVVRLRSHNKRGLQKLGKRVQNFIVRRVKAGLIKPALTAAWAARKSREGYPTHPLERIGDMIADVEVRVRK